MDYLEAAVLDCRAKAAHDDELIALLQQKGAQHGAPFYQAVLRVFTGLQLSLPQAAEYWTEMLAHRERMISALGRRIDLVPTIHDFLSLSPCPLNQARLIEEQTYARVIKETTHDSLTSLFNRNYFDQALELALSTARRYDSDVALLFVDIDNFKDINDTWGHKYGDAVLQEVARVILEQKRDSDIAARYGGEEFVLLMPHTQSIQGMVLAERVRRNIRERVSGLQDKPVTVTISGGLAAFPHNAGNSTELVQRADSALYLAKGAGKNLISMYKEEKRRYLRVKYREPLKIKELGFDASTIFAGISKDICIGGILFESDIALPIGSRIQVDLPIHADRNVLLIGTVVRVEAFGPRHFDIGMTISFKEMEKIASAEIANFLQNNMV